MHDLSRKMKIFSDACDEIGSAEMKALSMYLQMTLYGPVERFFLDTFTPEVLVCERHPLIETFVYGPLYVLLAGSGWDGSALEPTIRSVVDRSDGEVFTSVSGWHAAETERLGDKVGLWERFADVARPFRPSLRRRVADFAGRYRTTLPDVVLWLDVPPEQAAGDARRAARRGWLRPMRRRAFLSILRQGYLQLQESISQAFPDIRMHVVDTSDASISTARCRRA